MFAEFIAEARLFKTFNRFSRFIPVQRSGNEEILFSGNLSPRKQFEDNLQLKWRFFPGILPWKRHTTWRNKMIYRNSFCQDEQESTVLPKVSANFLLKFHSFRSDLETRHFFLESTKNIQVIQYESESPLNVPQLCYLVRGDWTFQIHENCWNPPAFATGGHR